MATPGGPRPGSLPPNFNPNALANSMKNLQVNQPDRQPSGDFGNGAPRPNDTPYAQHYPSITGIRPGQSPPGVFPRGPAPPGALGQAAFPPNMMSTRPTGPPAPQPLAYGSPPPGARPGQGPLSASHLPTGPPVPTHMSKPSVVSNGPPVPTSGMMQYGPRFPPFTGSDSMLRPEGEPPSAPAFSSRPSQLLQMPPNFNDPSLGAAPLSTVQPAPPLSASQQRMPPPPGPMQFPTPGSGMFRSPGSPGIPTWPQQQQQGFPSLPSPGPMQHHASFRPPPAGLMQQQPMFGMPSAPPLPNQSMILNQTGKSPIDMENIPRPFPSSVVILHETRQANQANPPPPATSDYIAMDTGNCSPRYMRCTINQIPCTVDLLSTSAMQLALLIQPLALPHPSEEPIQVVDFGEIGPVRCSRCKGYINPFMKFIDQGRHFICNLCGFTNETPHDYCCNLGPDGRRRDADERPELCRGTVEFVATKEFMLRDPMPAVYFFLIDVSMTSIQTGATAAACSAITQVISDLPEGPRTMVGIATFDSTIHFYNIRRTHQQVSMLVVPDIQDVYTPLQSDVIVQLAECRQQLEILLESIPTMFQSNKVADSAFGAAAMAAFLALKSTGGKLLVFHSVLPSIGMGSLSAREAEGRSNVSAGEKEVQKLLQPVDKTLNDLAIEFAGHQVCVDLFITTQTYVDIASLSVIPRTTGGQVYYYYPFSARCDSAKLYNDLRWNVTRPQGFEAVMRVRCSKGIQVQDYSGNFCKNIPTDVDIPAIDCDKTIMVSLKHDDKLQEGTECAFQCALLYTTVYGQRRIRVSTLSLPCTTEMANLFRSADLETQFACILKRAGNEIPKVPLAKVRDQATSACTNILYAYRKFCSTVPSPGQFILPEALKLLPIYVLALLKSSGLQSDGRIDERSFWINYVSHLPTPLVIPLVHPRMIAIHNLEEKEFDDSIVPTPIALSGEHITDEGVYLLENGEDCLIYVGSCVQPNLLQQLFSIPSVEGISSQFILEQYDNPLSKKLNAIVNEIRRQRCSYLRMKLCRKGDPSESLFFSHMVEDKMPSGPSYPEYIVQIHQKIRSGP